MPFYEKKKRTLSSSISFASKRIAWFNSIQSIEYLNGKQKIHWTIRHVMCRITVDEKKNKIVKKKHKMYKRITNFYLWTSEGIRTMASTNL